MVYVHCIFFFQAEDGIRDLVRSRGLGDVYKRQGSRTAASVARASRTPKHMPISSALRTSIVRFLGSCLLYTSDAADERSSVDLGGRRIIKNKTNITNDQWTVLY